MHRLAELLKAVNAYEHEIKCTLVCHADNHAEWPDYIRQIMWKCEQTGLNFNHAMTGIYSNLKDES